MFLPIWLIFSFFSLYEQIFKPSRLPMNADFHLFKTGIEPKWEDPECANGGKWSVTSNRKANLDAMWLETVYFLHAGLISVCRSFDLKTFGQLVFVAYGFHSIFGNQFNCCLLCR